MGAKAVILVMLAVAFMMGQHSMVKGDPDTDVEQSSCDGDDIKVDGYADSVEKALKYLVSKAPQAVGYDLQFSTSAANPIVYAHGTCNEQLTGKDCASCLRDARSNHIEGCAGKVGATTVLVDCSIRYDNKPLD